MSDVLHLPMKKKWYNMVLSGDKKEEYREYKPYWTSRIDNCIEESFVCGRPGPIPIIFRNGYGKKARWFKAYCEAYEIRDEVVHPEWGEGAYKGKPHYVLHIRGIDREGN